MTAEVHSALGRYGEWPSPIDADLVAAGSGSLSWPVHGPTHTWYCASDPATSTTALLRVAGAGEPERVLPDDFPVRTKAMGYGGRPYAVLADRLVFCRTSDQRLWAAKLDDLGPGCVPVPLTPADSDGTITCYADPFPGPDLTEVWCVRERTRAPHGNDPDNSGSPADPAPRTTRDIVAIPLDGSAADDPAYVRVVARSHHFLTCARVSPDGRRLAWIGWDHPAMPWEGTALMVADLVDGEAATPRCVLGGATVSVSQVEWADADTLYAMADPAGWWNLHQVDLRPDGGAEARCVLPMERDCAGPIWRVGSTWFAVTSAGVVFTEYDGDERLRLYSRRGGPGGAGDVRDLAPEWTEFGSDLHASPVGAEPPAVVVVASSATRPPAVLRVPLARDRALEPAVCWQTPMPGLAEYLPVGRRRVARGVGGRDVHYVYFPPTHPDHDRAATEAPPLLVHVHGGPTSRTSCAPDLEHAFFTSRGFAVASVDYGGSTGYGRDYRERLRHRWGIVDVEDSVAVAVALAAEGLADPDRTAIRGGSAGGWTALAALTSSAAFCAGAVYYPISDPLTWSRGHTHDFESRYVESLVGELPRDLAHYEQVSPLAHADRIVTPLVLLQGAADEICRPDQAQRIVDAVADRGLWHRYLTFEGEGHGFRQATSVAASLRAEAELYSHTMGIHVDPGAARRLPTSDHEIEDR